MGIHYKQQWCGDWVQPKPRGWRMKCCDCRLVHRVNFRIAKSGKRERVQLQVFRDARATAAARRGTPFGKYNGTTRREVAEFIRTIRRAAPQIMRAVFTRGGCYAFSQIIAARFPCAIPYTTRVFGSHVITRIGDRFWDIDGERHPSKRSIRLRSNYRPMTAAQCIVAAGWQCDWDALFYRTKRKDTRPCHAKRGSRSRSRRRH